MGMLVPGVAGAGRAGRRGGKGRDTPLAPSSSSAKESPNLELLLFNIET